MGGIPRLCSAAVRGRGETLNVLARRTKLFGRTLKIWNARVAGLNRRTPAQDPQFGPKLQKKINWRPLVCDGDHGRLGPQKRWVFPQATRGRHDIGLWRPSAKTEKLFADVERASCSTSSSGATLPGRCFGAKGINWRPLVAPAGHGLGEKP